MNKITSTRSRLSWALLILILVLVTTAQAASVQEDLYNLVPLTIDNVAQIEQIATFEQDAVCTAAFNPNGNLLASSAGGSVILRNAHNFKPVGALPTRYNAVRSIAFSPDGSLIAATSSENCGRTIVQVWDVTTGNIRLERLQDIGHSATGVAFSPDGKLIAAGTGCVFDIPGSATIKVWDIATGKLQKDVGLVSFVSEVQFSLDGALVGASGGDGLIRLVDLASGMIRTEIRASTDGLVTFAFSPDGTKIVAAGDLVSLWDVRTGDFLYRIQRDVGQLIDIAFSPDGQLIVSGGLKDTLAFWDTKKASDLGWRQIGRENDSIASVAFSPEGTLIATCDHGQMLRLWGVRRK